MKSQSKPLLFRIKGRDLVSICNEKMICAARDLAEFTKNGINASFIVALAHKCENFESSLDPRFMRQQQADFGQAEHEIRESLIKICELGRRIWSNNPSKYQDYVISPKGVNVRDTSPPNLPS